MSTVDEATALLLAQEDYDESEWEPIDLDVDAGHQKHDATNYFHIFKRLTDETYWKISFTCSYNYGLDEYSVYATQVEQKEVVTWEWVAV